MSTEQSIYILFLIIFTYSVFAVLQISIVFLNSVKISKPNSIKYKLDYYLSIFASILNLITLILLAIRPFNIFWIISGNNLDNPYAKLESYFYSSSLLRLIAIIFIIQAIILSIGFFRKSLYANRARMHTLTFGHYSGKDAQILSTFGVTIFIVLFVWFSYVAGLHE